MSRRPANVSLTFALSRAFPASPSMRQSRAKSPRQGPTWGRRGAEVDLARVIPNISVWYAVWYITFSPEPNVVLNSIYARKNNLIPEVQSQMTAFVRLYQTKQDCARPNRPKVRCSPGGSALVAVRYCLFL